MIIDIWQDTDYKDSTGILQSLLITILSIILTIPIAILLDIALAPIEIGAGIIYLIRTRKDKEVEKCTDYMHKEEKVDMKTK
jgi:hypothetical protein